MDIRIDSTTEIQIQQIIHKRYKLDTKSTLQQAGHDTSWTQWQSGYHASLTQIKLRNIIDIATRWKQSTIDIAINNILLIQRQAGYKA